MFYRIYNNNNNNILTARRGRALSIQKSHVFARGKFLFIFYFIIVILYVLLLLLFHLLQPLSTCGGEVRVLRILKLNGSPLDPPPKGPHEFLKYHSIPFGFPMRWSGIGTRAGYGSCLLFLYNVYTSMYKERERVRE